MSVGTSIIPISESVGTSEEMFFIAPPSGKCDSIEAYQYKYYCQGEERGEYRTHIGKNM